MTVGCVKELKRHEYRVGLTPTNVREYCTHGHRVVVQAGAGAGSGFPDDQYQLAGAEIATEAAEVWHLADMVVKVKEPLPEEYALVRQGQVVFTYFHLAADHGLTKAMLDSGCKAEAYETERDAAGALPLLKPMSEVAGRLSVQEGARCLEKPQGGRGVLLGGVPGVARGNIVILGGGMVGTNACKMAIGAGARVTVLDTSTARLEYLDDIFGSQIETLYSSAAALEELLPTADLVIGAVLIPGGATPKLLRREHLTLMQPGSVIVDVAIDQGGCVETSRPTYHDEPTFEVDGVIHYCVGNMPGAVPNTSTRALTGATLPYGLAIADMGLEAAVRQDAGLAAGVNTYLGSLTCKEVAEAFGMPYTPLSSFVL